MKISGFKTLHAKKGDLFVSLGPVNQPLSRNHVEEVIEECASFPYGDHDDLVDSTTQAVMRFRQGGFVSHPEDEKDNALPRTERTYY